MTQLQGLEFTGQNNRRNTGKRAIDTEILLREAQSQSPASERYMKAIARMNYLHARYRKAGKILDDDLLHTLGSNVIDALRIVENGEWRRLTEVEKCAIGIFHKNLGEDMGIPYTALPCGEAGWTDGVHFATELRDWAINHEKVAAIFAPTNYQYFRPTIVAVNGPAAGVGLTITLLTAIRVAWSGAKVGLPFARQGLTLESCSAFFLPRLVGLGNATHMATMGATYAAPDPIVSGLFSKILPSPQETVAHAVELAADIAENTSLTSTKLMRDMLLYCPDTAEETHASDSRVFILVVGSKDNMEGVKSFIKKKNPNSGGYFLRVCAILAMMES